MVKHIESHDRPAELVDTSQRNASAADTNLQSPFELSPKQFKRNLTKALKAALPFQAIGEGQADAKAMFGQYVDSLAKLEERQQEVRDFVNRMKSTNVSYEVFEGLDDIRDKLESKVTSDFKIRLTQPLHTGTAELAAKSTAEVRQELNESLHRAVVRTVDQLIAGLDNLVDKKVVGLVTWTSQNTVRYDFFERFVSVGGRTTEFSRGEAAVSANSPTGWVRRLTKRDECDVTCRRQRHIHEAIDAFQTGLDNTQVIMPPKVVALCEAVPNWLRSEFVVLDGYLIRQNIHEEVIIRSKVVAETHQEVVVHGLEPGVVCGYYVFAGWGPAEIDDEKERRSIEEATRFEPFWLVSAAGLQLLALVLASFQLAQFATLVFMASVGCMFGAAIQIDAIDFKKSVPSIGSNTYVPPRARWLSLLGFSFVASASVTLGGIQLMLAPVTIGIRVVAGILILAGAISVVALRDFPLQVLKPSRKGPKQ